LLCTARQNIRHSREAHLLDDLKFRAWYGLRYGRVWARLWPKLRGGEQGTNSCEVFDGPIESLVPMKRSQTPEENAATVPFLCSSFAGSITGQVIAVDGGVTI
jgi:NAD(P)-dependent dehydrogenase (short-subunit alcohol dehydrogenase family)